MLFRSKPGQIYRILLIAASPVTHYNRYTKKGTKEMNERKKEIKNNLKK